MAVEDNWNAADKIMNEMEKYKRYQSILPAMRMIANEIRHHNELFDVYPSMSFYGLSLSRCRTGFSVELFWDDERGYVVSMTKASPEEHWDEVSTRNMKEALSILLDYLQRT